MDMYQKITYGHKKKAVTTNYQGKAPDRMYPTRQSYKYTSHDRHSGLAWSCSETTTSTGRGRGVFCTTTFERGSVVCDYKGELISWQEGKTRFVLPQHAQALYRGPEDPTKFRDVLDGLSNTIMAIIANDDQAVTWTKPDDLEVDLDHPRRGWATGEEDAIVVLADGATVILPPDVEDAQVAAMITRNGQELIDFQLERAPGGPAGHRRSGLPFLIGREQEVLIEELALDRFLHHGIGNQIGIHICDDRPLVDLNVSRLAGLFTSFGRGGGFMGPDLSMVGVLALAMNTPVYVSIPVENAEVVDDTLGKLDRFLIKITRD